MKIEIKQISDLKAAEYNPRQNNKKQEIDLSKGLKKFGLVQPIVFNEKTGNIVGGHFRVRELVKLGYTEVECVIVDLSLKDEKELNIRLNANGGQFDFDMLANGGWDEKMLNDWGLSVWMPEEDLDKFEPNLIPQTNYADITKEEIQKEAQKLAIQMIRENKGKECICPNCGEEFEIYE